MTKNKLFGLLGLMVALALIFFLVAAGRNVWIQGNNRLSESSEALIGITWNFDKTPLTHKQKDLVRVVVRGFDIELRDAIELSRQRGDSSALDLLLVRVKTKIFLPPQATYGVLEPRPSDQD